MSENPNATGQYRTPPNVREGIIEGYRNSPWWYRYIQALDTGQAPATETKVTWTTGSPYTYTAPRGGFVIIQGGSVSQIAFSRSGTFYVTGQTSGTFPVSQNDQLKITYSGKPSVVFVPT